MSAAPSDFPDFSRVTAFGGASEARALLRGIRAAAEDIHAFADGLDEAQLIALPQSDRRTYRGLRDALAEISKRVGEMSAQIFIRHPNVDWPGWTGVRDIVSHNHFDEELHRLGPTITDDVPLLLAAVRAELARLGEDGSKDGKAGST